MKPHLADIFDPNCYKKWNSKLLFLDLYNDKNILMRKLTILLLMGLMTVSHVVAQRTISGAVTDSESIPLIGASILVDGTSIGTITDIDGSYQFEVPEETTHLIFSYTGYTTQKIGLWNKSIQNAILTESATLLDEVVVIGYGTTSKRNLTDNVVKLTSKDIEGIPIANFQSTMSGKAAGVRITPTNGKVDAGLNINIRGVSSIGVGSQPLYVLDGVPLININESRATGSAINPLLSLSATEIESIDILKDASSAAIYGARGANGVVLITTKKGKKGKATVSLNASTGISQPTNLVEWLNTEQYLELFREAAAFQPWGPDFIEGRFVDLSGDNEVGTVDTDWNDIAFRDGTQSNLDVSISGGDEKTTYYFGGSFNDTEGILLGNNLDRISGRVNLKHNFSKILTAGLNIGYSKTSIDRISNDNSFTTPLQAIAQAPLSPPRLADGTPFGGTLYPNFLLEEEHGGIQTDLRRVTGKAFVELQILDNLKFNSDYGYDVNFTTENQFRGSLTPFQSTNGQAFSLSATSESYVFTNYFTFNQELGANNLLNLVAGMEYNDTDRRVTSVTGTEFPSDDLQNISSAAEITDGEGFLQSITFYLILPELLL